MKIELGDEDRALLQSLALPKDQDLERVKGEVAQAARLNLSTFKSGSLWPESPIPLKLQIAANEE